MPKTAKVVYQRSYPIVNAGVFQRKAAVGARFLDGISDEFSAGLVDLDIRNSSYHCFHD